MDELLSRLRAALSETWAFYFKAHSFHWNVRGPLFRQFHEMFGDLYEDAHGAVDGLAERIRTLGALAPASLDEIAADTTIRFTDAPAAAAMLVQLVDGNQSVIDALNGANEAALAAGEDGISNYLQDRIDAHKKWAWMLKTTISEDAGA